MISSIMIFSHDVTDPSYTIPVCCTTSQKAAVFNSNPVAINVPLKRADSGAARGSTRVGPAISFGDLCREDKERMARLVQKLTSLSREKKELLENLGILYRAHILID